MSLCIYALQQIRQQLAAPVSQATKVAISPRFFSQNKPTSSPISSLAGRISIKPDQLAVGLGVVGWIGVVTRASSRASGNSSLPQEHQKLPTEELLRKRYWRK